MGNIEKFKPGSVSLRNFDDLTEFNRQNKGLSFYNLRRTDRNVLLKIVVQRLTVFNETANENDRMTAKHIEKAAIMLVDDNDGWTLGDIELFCFMLERCKFGSSYGQLSALRIMEFSEKYKAEKHEAWKIEREINTPAKHPVQDDDYFELPAQRTGKL